MKNPGKKKPAPVPGEIDKTGTLPSASDQEILNVLQGAFAKVEAEYGKPVLVEENTLEGIARNAIVIGHPNRFKDMIETMTFINKLVDKLVAKGHLSKAAVPYARPIVAAVLRYLWDTQNLFYLAPEMVAGQANVLMAFIKEINTLWVSPEKSAWFRYVSAYPKKVDEVLHYIDSLSWEAVYKHLDPSMEELFQLADASGKNVEKSHREMAAQCSAYLAGVIIEKNTFSFLQGSVPESIEERMSALYFKLSKDHERLFYPYLMEGFRAVREQPMNELDRWKMSK